MARLIVQFSGDAEVVVDGNRAGRTNRVIPLSPGQHVVQLESEATEPSQHAVVVAPNAAAADIVRIGFASTEERIDHFSPLYCCYNGFLLGQFLSLSFAKCGRKDYFIRRSRMLEFLEEIEVVIDLPAEPPELGGDVHSRLLDDVLPKIGICSRPLTEFVLLGSLLTHYGILGESDPDTAKATLEQFDWLREKHKLPPIDPARFVLRPGSGDPDEVLSPSLAYLAQVIDRLEIEPDTAFVIMPFKPPYSAYFSTFYRPSLQQAGYRAFRAWGGLASEDYCDLLLKLIAKSGIVWADVSELNFNVLYEIGAAHALGKPSMLVVRKDCAGTTPANIGHDAVVQYSENSDDWPRGTVLLMAALIATLKLAAEHGERLRVSADALATVLEQVGERLVSILSPPEAQHASKEGQKKLNAGDYAGAEQCFDEAIQLGLDDAPTLLGRGWSRVVLGRYAEAEADFDSVLDSESEDPSERNHREVAAYFRGIAREQQDNFLGARSDYGLSIDLGHEGADVFRRRARVQLGLGELEAARKDADHAREIEPDDADTDIVDGDVLLAEARFDAAVAAYDRGLARERTAGVEFNRALALLLGGHSDKALDGYRRGSSIANAEDRERALADLKHRAADVFGAPACEQILKFGIH